MQPTLVHLSQTELTIGEGEDIRGRRVIDTNGDEIGRIDDLIIDDRGSRVRFLEVAHGGFLGIGQEKCLIPVDAITQVMPDRVQIDRSSDQVAGAPPYDPELTDERYYEDLYGYYGYVPFWGAGYMYPPFPYYP